MNTSDPWNRLADSVRRRAQTPPGPPAEMPFGFETRVLARLRMPSDGATEVWARLAARAVALGAAVLLLSWLALAARPPGEPLAADEIEQLLQEVLNP